MLINCPTNIKTILDLDQVFNNNEVIKNFIIEIFEVSEKINGEFEQKFATLFFRQGKRDEYLNLDYKILIVAVLNFLQKTSISVENFANIKKEFSYYDYSKLDNSMKNLLFILSKRNVVYFDNNKKYFYQYQFTVEEKECNHNFKIDAISLNYSKVKELFIDNKNMTNKFEKLIIKNYIYFKEKKKYIKNKNYCIQEFSQFRDYFMNEF